MSDEALRTVRLYAVEDQEIWRKVYQVIFPPGSTVNLSGISTNRDVRAIKDAASALNPDVLLIGAKSLNQDFIEEVNQIRAEFSRVGIVLLFLIEFLQIFGLLFQRLVLIP